MSFSGLSISLSSLYAQRKAIDVTGQNIANANTDGYSRQRVTMVSDAGPVHPAVHARWNGAGNGVRSDGVDRLRDQFLEVRSHQEHAALSGLAQVQGTLGRIELAFAEPGDTGIAAQMAELWAGWDDVANRPDDVAARAQLVERASTLTATFDQLDGTLGALASSSVDQLTTIVSEVNATGARIAELNGTIQTMTNAGYPANDLLDQRDLLVGQLAQRVGVTTRPGEAGAVDVFVGGVALVRGVRPEALEVTAPTAATASVRWAKDGLPAAVTGQAGGLLEAATRTVPDHRAALDAIAFDLAALINDVHRQGSDLDGSAGWAPPGGPPAAPPAPATAWTADVFVVVDGRIAVNPVVAADPRRLAAAADSPGVPSLDGSVAQRLAALADDGDGPEGAYRSLVVSLGVAAQTANRRVDIQSAITRQVDGAREAEAGVNLDEEMVNMIQFQHAYDAAARMMTAVDQMLDTLINRTGLVGR